MLNYQTKTEQTLDVLLPLLLPVVERIRDNSTEEPSKEIAVRLVRSCLCKQLTSLNIGGPAAASKVFGLPDAKLSHKPTPCPMGPLLAWASSRDGPRPAPDTSNSDNQGQQSDEDSDVDTGVMVTAVHGKLTVNQRAYIVYLHRCDPDDTDHPLHDLSYFSWHRLVRLEKYSNARARKGKEQADGDATADGDEADTDGDGDDAVDEPSGDEVHEDSNPATSRRGRPACDRHECVGPFARKWVQVRYLKGYLSYSRLAAVEWKLYALFSAIARVSRCSPGLHCNERTHEKRSR